MCGIAGYIGKVPRTEGQLRDTLETLRRRGPDAEGFRNFELGDVSLMMIHSRLSIIDLDERANQPYHFDGLWLTFNGEIYNYIEIREELKGLGYSFVSESDTEVLIKAFHCWGDECVLRFEGMWAFALFDERKMQLCLSKDRFAEKPLFLFEDTNGIFFASEVKQIEALSGKTLEKNLDHAMAYLVNGHKSMYKSSRHFYHKLSEVDFGTNVKIDTNLNVESNKYWQPSYTPQFMSEGEAIERIQAGLVRSVELRMRADVPLAFCLSGGVDSSAMASIASKVLNQSIQTFSIIDSDQRYNELENIQATIDDLGCDHHLIELDSNFNYLDLLDRLISYHDAPIATISYLVHSRLIEAMHKTGFKVSISGTGADELFTGYYDHFLLQIASIDPELRSEQIRLWNQFPAKDVRNPFLQDPMRFVKTPEFRDHIYLNNDEFRQFLKRDFSEAFTEVDYSSDLLRKRMMNELYHEVVRVILREDDLNSMYYSIENRSPFLDSKLFETAYSIPSELLIKEGYNKYLLRKSMKGILNDKVRLCREKKGFNASINSLIDFNNPHHRSFILDDGPIYDLIHKSRIEDLLKKESFPNSYKKFFFNFLNLKMWLDS
ncbi:MAG: asparagine synthase (glutamine-hydrolyzing) [Euryarchaeota archaeon]|jgi:asparagine synthase (glutamine-hydrolysing)|nr:asparagine synthase (glutamine-hydrolyzing) [Euryarchaeota archaeon]